jgi:hypothetical protein
MSFNYLHFLGIYILGEIVLNLTFFNYLKKYFKVDKITSPDETDGQIFRI